MSKGEKQMSTQKNGKGKITIKVGKRAKTPKTPLKVQMNTKPSSSKSVKSVGKRSSKGGRKGILKLPAIKSGQKRNAGSGEEQNDQTEENTRQNAGKPKFGRAGVERLWEENARKYFEENQNV